MTLPLSQQSEQEAEQGDATPTTGNQCIEEGEQKAMMKQTLSIYNMTANQLDNCSDRIFVRPVQFP